MSAADRYPNLDSLAQHPERQVNPAIGEQCRDALAEIDHLKAQSGEFFKQVGARYATYEDEIERLRKLAHEALDLANDLQRTHPDPYDSAYQIQQLRQTVTPL